MDYAALYEAHTPEQYAALRESIAAHGVLEPILVTEDGVIINGHTRAAIAAELGIDCPRAVAVMADEGECLERLVLANGNRRQLRGERRAEVVNGLRARGWSNVRMADVLGLDPKTTAAVPARPAENGQVEQVGKRPRVVTETGKVRDAKRLTIEQVETRRAAVAELTEQGYGLEAIAGALDVHRTTVQSDRRALKLPPRRGARPVRSTPPPPVAWWVGEAAPPPPPPVRRTAQPEPIPADAPRWLASKVMRRVELLRGTIHDEGGANLLAWEVYGALAAGDDAWLKATAATLAELALDLGTLGRVVTDEKVRRSMMAPDSSARLRAV